VERPRKEAAAAADTAVAVAAAVPLANMKALNVTKLA